MSRKGQNRAAFSTVNPVLKVQDNQWLVNCQTLPARLSQLPNWCFGALQTVLSLKQSDSEDDDHSCSAVFLCSGVEQPDKHVSADVLQLSILQTTAAASIRSERVADRVRQRLRLSSWHRVSVRWNRGIWSCRRFPSGIPPRYYIALAIATRYSERTTDICALSRKPRRDFWDRFRNCTKLW